jgi:hypothetical protein
MADVYCDPIFPHFLGEIKPRLWQTVLGVITAVLVLLLQIHYGVITSQIRPRIFSILWPYGLLLLAFGIYHPARTPWLISNEHLDAIGALKRKLLELESRIAAPTETIQNKDDDIRALKQPKRSTAEQHGFDKTKKALTLLKEPGVIALRFLRSQGSLTFSFAGYVSAALPAGLSHQNALWVYRHCASEGILNSKKNLGNTEETFAILPNMEKVLNELLFGDGRIEA